MPDISKNKLLSSDFAHHDKRSFINVNLTKVLAELSAPDANPFQVPEIIWNEI